MNGSKNGLRILFFIAMGFLAACHQNPIVNISPEKTIGFLISASRYAEEKLGVLNGVGGGYYSACMSNTKVNIDCEMLYKTMLVYAKQDKDFKDLSLSDLTDKKRFMSLKEDYDATVFDSI